MASQTSTTMRTSEGPGGSSQVSKTTTYETRSSYVAESSTPTYRPTIAPRTYIIQRQAIGGLGSAAGGGSSMSRSVERAAQFGGLQAGAPAGRQTWPLVLIHIARLFRQYNMHFLLLNSRLVCAAEAAVGLTLLVSVDDQSVSGSVAQSCPWVGSTRGLGWVGLSWVGLSWVGWVEILQFSMGWVGSNMRKVLYFLMITQHTFALQLSCSAVVEKFTYYLRSVPQSTFYFMVVKIVFICSSMIDINCRQFAVSCIRLGWVGSIFLDLRWVGLNHRKWTHGQLWCSNHAH